MKEFSERQTNVLPKQDRERETERERKGWRNDRMKWNQMKKKKIKWKIKIKKNLGGNAFQSRLFVNNRWLPQHHLGSFLSFDPKKKKNFFHFPSLPPTLSVSQTKSRLLLEKKERQRRERERETGLIWQAILTWTLQNECGVLGPISLFALLFLFFLRFCSPKTR